MEPPSDSPMLPAAKLARREGMNAVEKLCRSAISSSGSPATAPAVRKMNTASGGDGARRHQSLLDDEPKESTDALSAVAAPSVAPLQEVRGGPKRLEELQLRVLSKTDHFLVINKHEDHRLDGDFDATIQKALYRDFPSVEKFRWIHQLDFATSGVMCIGVERDATALACRLFRQKLVQKEYLAVVRGHLPFHPRDFMKAALESQPPRRVRACAFSKLGLLIKETEEFDRYKTQLRGSPAHQKHRDYPRGVWQAPAIFQMEKNELIREKRDGKRVLTDAEEAFLSLAWTDLDKAEQRKYQERMKVDKVRFLKELIQFLDTDRERLAEKRQYDVGEKTEDGVEEPVAYIFDDPIAEPDRDSFRMRIGDRSIVDDAKVAGKDSATIAFVLGHGTFENEAVTKVLLRPLTGRRHQLRLHLSHNGFPIIGDATYASTEETAPRMMLHAWRLWLMGDAAAREKYGELYFESPDPFEGIVPSQRTLTTMTRE